MDESLDENVDQPWPLAADSAPEQSRYAHLPEPIRLDQTVTSSEAGPHPEEKDDYWREVEWLLRVTGGF
jgi:hypothetical protein